LRGHGAGPGRVAALGLCASAAPADGIMLVQAGAFWMGGGTDDPSEAPRHGVSVGDRWSVRDKVTNLEFAGFLAVFAARRRRI
jgi:formylglycine-generating enzyme required for sulfatase activity